MSKAQVISIDTKLSARKRRELVDEFGRISLEIATLKKRKERYEQLRKQIAGWHENADPEATFTEEGDEWSVEFSAQSFEREITSMERLKRYLGLKTFLQRCKFNLGDIDELVPVDDRAEFLSCERSGPRTAKPIQKVRAEAA